MSTPLVPLSAAERDAITGLVDLGRGRFDEWDAACAARAMALYDAEKARGDSLERERDALRAALTAYFGGPDLTSPRLSQEEYEAAADKHNAALDTLKALLTKP